MRTSSIIIITGLPGTGKTTLGRTLSDKYKFVFVSKDALKERMFDALGWSDKAWSLKVSAAAHRITDDIIAQELKAGHSIIVESNFKLGIDSERFRNIQAQYGCQLVQILCWADGETVYQRFAGRIGTEARHQGHVEALPLETIHQEFLALKGKDKPLDIPGTTIELDTSDIDAIEYQKIYDAIDQAIAA